MELGEVGGEACVLEPAAVEPDVELAEGAGVGAAGVVTDRRVDRRRAVVLGGPIVVSDWAILASESFTLTAIIGTNTHGPQSSLARRSGGRWPRDRRTRCTTR